MPLHLGDANDAFLTLRKTQYFFLQRWNEGLGNFNPGSGPALGPGEQLDKATLGNCLGGRLGPGIDLTFVIRERAIFVQPWKTSGAGPAALVNSW
jgi:L-lysine epsilon oxidase C-terminal domain